MKNYLKQHLRQHDCQFKNGGARLQSLLLLMLLTWMLLPVRMAAQTDYDASVTFTAITGSDGYFIGESYENLFDGKKTESDFSKWCCDFSNPTYVIFEASKPGMPVGYTITTGNDNRSQNGRNPKSWNLYGNNEGENGRWTLIQAVTDDEMLKDENYTSYDFTCDGISSYKYFKWEITATKGASVMQVAEFELKLITCTHKKEDGSSALGEALSTVPATCTEHSYSTYKCSICNNTVKIEHEGDLAPHTLIHHEANAPKCTETGNKEYWQCDVCSKLFGDEAATNELADLSAIVIPATGHKNNTQGKCSVCGAIDPHYAQYDTSVTFKAIGGMNGKGAIDGQGYENLFDGKKTKDNFSKWACTHQGEKTYVIFEASQPGTPIGYTITASDFIPTSSYDGRYPAKWFLYANNEGIDGKWTLIGTDGEESFNDALKGENYKSCDFECNVEEPYKSYKYFKWNIENIGYNWDDIMEVGEFELKLVTCWHKNADGSSALGETISTKPATCISHSFTTHMCSICNKEVDVEEDSEYGPHILTFHEAKAPTCTQTGSKEYWQCSVCDKLFGDEAANNEFANLSATVIPAVGHNNDSKGVCSVCGAVDTRYEQFDFKDVIVKCITDNEYPWEALDLTVDGLSGADIPEGSKGLMSSKDNSYDESSCAVFSIKSDKPFVLSFNCGVTVVDNAFLKISVDGAEYEYSNFTQKEIKIMFSAGEHNMELFFEKAGRLQLDRAFIYNMNVEYSYTGAVALYEETTKTMTLKTVSNSEISDNMFAVYDKQPIYRSVPNKEEEMQYIVIDESFKSFIPTTLERFFTSLHKVVKIEGLGNINTSQVKDMSYMFYSLKKLKEFDIDNLNTDNVEVISHMFTNLHSMETLVWSGSNTENVKSMESAFQSLDNLKKLDISGLNTTNVENMYLMFGDCGKLKEIYLGENFSTDKVTYYDRIFDYTPSSVIIYNLPNQYEATKADKVFDGHTVKPYVRINSKAKYGTLCVPIGSMLEDGTFKGFDKLYTISEYNAEEAKIMLKKATSIEPGKSYIYQRTLADDAEANVITFEYNGNKTTVPVNDGSLLKGTFEATTAPSGSYVLQSDGMFHPVRSNTIKVGAYRAYLQIPGYDQDGGYAKNFQMVFEDNEATYVKGIYDNAGSNAPVVYYDLMGRRVSSPSKGQVYIVNGKKVRF